MKQLRCTQLFSWSPKTPQNKERKFKSFMIQNRLWLASKQTSYSTPDPPFGISGDSWEASLPFATGCPKDMVDSAIADFLLLNNSSLEVDPDLIPLCIDHQPGERSCPHLLFSLLHHHQDFCLGQKHCRKKAITVRLWGDTFGTKT